jgi:NTP pyrophosphatase (non-canonical NTP hydrolase)
MEFEALIERAVSVRAQYAQFERRQYGAAWTPEELALGLVGDVGDLAKLVMAEQGRRIIPDSRNRLAHELADCLWSILVLAEVHQIDLEQAFLATMDEIETHLKGKNAGAG